MPKRNELIIIKKYANRRLYNTSTSMYITLEDLAGMVREGYDFQVVDAKSGEDLTKDVLTQIIVAEEAKGHNLLPVGFLRELIKMYGDNLQWIVPRYLENTMANFTANQERLRAYMKETLGPFSPFDQLQKMGQNQAQFFDQAFKMFTPFGGAAGPQNEKSSGSEKGDIQSQLDRLQRELEAIKNRKS